MDRAEKREFVAQLNDVFSTSASVVVAHYAGLTVANMTELRSTMRAAGGTVKVAKNRLVKIALQDSGASGMSEFMTGQTVLAYADDPVTAPKVMADYAKKNDKLVLLGGAMGAETLTADQVKALAELPSLDELRAKLIGLVQAPAQKLAVVTQAPAAQLARVLQAYADKEAA